MKKDNNSKKNTRQLIGQVVSAAMDKTVVVAVNRVKKHPKYKKRFKITTKYKAHDEKNAYKVGEKVEIKEIRPLSNDKRWRVSKRIK